MGEKRRINIFSPLLYQLSYLAVWGRVAGIAVSSNEGISNFAVAWELEIGSCP